jgi:hypothetical protein
MTTERGRSAWRVVALTGTQQSAFRPAIAHVEPLNIKLVRHPVPRCSSEGASGIWSSVSEEIPDGNEAEGEAAERN